MISNMRCCARSWPNEKFFEKGTIPTSHLIKTYAPYGAATLLDTSKKAKSPIGRGACLWTWPKKDHDAIITIQYTKHDW